MLSPNCLLSRFPPGLERSLVKTYLYAVWTGGSPALTWQLLGELGVGTWWEGSSTGVMISLPIKTIGHFHSFQQILEPLLGFILSDAAQHVTLRGLKIFFLLANGNWGAGFLTSAKALAIIQDGKRCIFEGPIGASFLARVLCSCQMAF